MLGGLAAQLGVYCALVGYSNKLREITNMGDPAEPTGNQRAGVVWNKAEMETSFANVVNIQGTREQVEFFFGINRSWDPDDGSSVQVDLTNRVIMTPYAAKRLQLILAGVLREYESRHGVLKVEDK
jgi:hypothetical protein